jgi:RNA polymerase sigma-70 factor (ECF subfamily)
MKTDEDLLKQIGRGDEDAFSELYQRYQSAIFRFAYHMTGSSGAAEDLTQDVFMTILKATDKFDPHKGFFSAYLFGIARHHISGWMRRNRLHVPFPDQPQNPMESADVLTPLAELTRGQIIEAVRNAILTLPERYREAMIVCDLQEMTYEEASAALGCAVGTVRSRLHRARHLLMQKLSNKASKQRTNSQEPNGDSYEMSAI